MQRFRDAMQTYSIPTNAGKFIIVVVRGGHYAVWNRKEGKMKISIPVKTKKEAVALCERLNKKQHNGSVSA